MKRHLTLVVAMSFLIAGSTLLLAAEGELIKKDRKLLEGTWQMLSYDQDGIKPISEDQLKQVRVIIDANGKVTVRAGENIILEATTKIDPTKKPKAIDITFTQGQLKGKTALGIYEVAGDTYRYCRAAPGQPRPKEFSAKAESGHTLVVYQRAKP